VEPSSLVFVAIIGVWAAYLVPHWLRKRDELAQSRTGDRFSGGLRVLNRRRRTVNVGHRSGDAVLTSPRVVVDSDGEFLYIPADRALAARAKREAELAAVEAEEVAAAAEEAATAEEAAAVAAEEAAVAAEAEEVARADAEAEEAAAVQAEAEAAAEAAEIVAAEAERVAAVATAAPAPTPAPAASPAERAVTHSSPSSPASVRRAPVEASTSSSPAPTEEATMRESDAPVHERPYDLDVAIACARIAARRRAVIMALLLVATVSSWGVSTVPSVPSWVVLPATVLLVMHMLASRVAGLRSRETLMVLAAQLHSAEVAQARPQQHAAITTRPVDQPAAAITAPVSERVARRAAAVGAETWEPVPVPPPTYTLKPAVHRPEPAPLDLPAAPQPEAPAAAVSRGALPRRAADIERILALESDLDQLFQHRAG
jgi:hypothetical protein